MAYVIGDPNHIAVHNDLITELAAMGATNLPDVAGLGDLGHVADHNLIRSALIEIETAWGVTGTPLPPVATVGGTGHVDDHNTIDAAIAYLYANGYNEATGGTVTDVPNYNGTGQTWRVHKFTANGTLTVIRARNPFRWLVTGGGGGCGWTEGSQPCGGGNAASASNDSATLAEGDYAITIGAGGTNGQYGVDIGNYPGGGGNGGTTVFGSLANCGGGQGGPYNGGNRGGGPQLPSNITGTQVTYCNGPTNSNVQNGAGTTAYTGMGPYSGPPGGPGVVIVAYQIAG